MALLVVAFERLVHVLPVKGGTRIDDAVAHALLSIQDDAGIIVFTWISWMGDTALAGMLLVAVVILAHRRRWAAAVTVVIASLGGMMIDASLKSVFHRARPDYALELITGPTWSFPSGHSMASIVGFGVLAYFRRELEKNPHRRVIISITALLLIIAVGFSRLYLGAHYLTDVTGGFLVGGIWLIVCLEGYRLASRHDVPITTST